MINDFRGAYSFLSNFYKAPVTYRGITYSNSEAAFQAAKTLDEAERKTFANLEPAVAKRRGRQVALRSDWEKIKVNVMYEVCYAKFTQNPELKEKLLATEYEYLEEGNTWRDRTWGTVNGKGKNLLGKILMVIRAQLRDECTVEYTPYE